MQKRIVRLGLLMAFLVAGMALLPMAASAAKALASDSADPVAQVTVIPITPPPGGTVPTAVPTETVPPMPTATSTPVSPLPTPAPTQVPPRPHPTQPPHRPAPAPTATPAGPPVMRIGQYKMIKVLGDRMTPVLYAVTDNGWLYRSADDGKSWSLVTSSPEITDFILSPDNADVLYSGAGAQCNNPDAALPPFYRSENRGKSWEELSTGAGLVALLPDPSNEDQLFAADCVQLYLTTDGGVNWYTARDADQADFWRGLQVVDMSDAPLMPPVQGGDRTAGSRWNHIVGGAVAEGGVSVVAVSSDQGRTWQDITPGGERASVDLRVIVADPTNINRIWFADGLGVWGTEDGGETWTLFDQGLEAVVSQDGGSLSNDLVYSSAMDRLYLATEHGLFVKEASADAWTAVTGEDFGQQAIFSMVLTESAPTTLWLNTEDGVYTYAVK